MKNPLPPPPGNSSVSVTLAPECFKAMVAQSAQECAITQVGSLAIKVLQVNYAYINTRSPLKLIFKFHFSVTDGASAPMRVVSRVVVDLACQAENYKVMTSFKLLSCEHSPASSHPVSDEYKAAMTQVINTVLARLKAHAAKWNYPLGLSCAQINGAPMEVLVNGFLQAKQPETKAAAAATPALGKA